MTLRIKLLIGFLVVAAVGLLSILLLVRAQTTAEVGRFMGGYGMEQSGLADTLEQYYQKSNSWMGVADILPAGMGMGNQRGGKLSIRIADANGVTVFDNTGAESIRFTKQERNDSIELHDQTNRLIGYLHLKAPQGNMNNLSRASAILIGRLTDALIKAGMVAGVLAVLIAVLISSQILRPIKNLAAATEAMARGDLSQRVPEGGPDELGSLAKSFNRMADHLQDSQQLRRNMTADIAHELRTPLAVQKAHLEALQDGVYPLTIESLEPILSQNEMLASLVDDLRTLALADAGELVLVKSNVDAGQLLSDALSRFEAPAEAQRKALRLSIPRDKITIFGDKRRLDQVLNNLISNALRHSPEGQDVEISLVNEQNQALITIRDHGKGIPAEKLDHLFERYHRSDTRPVRTEDTGLGLTISKYITEAHGGTLRAANHLDGGAQFTLTLPIDPPGANDPVQS